MNLKKTIISSALALSLLSMTSIGFAAEISPNVKTILDTAVKSNDKGRFINAVDLIIRSYPQDKDAIVAYASQIFPSIAGDIRTHVNGMDIFKQATAAEEKSDFQVKSLMTDHADFLSLSKWKGSAEAGFSTSSGDTDAQALSAGLKLNRKFNNIWEHSFRMNLDFSRANGQQNKERAVGDYQIYYRNWDRGYAFSKVTGEYDKFSGFDYRFTESIGAGYTVYDKPEIKWSIDGGPGLRQNKLDNGPTESEFVMTANSKFRYWFRPDMNIGNEIKSAIGQDRFTINALTDFTTKINTSLSARFSLELDYDSKVPLGTSKLDTITRASIIYDF